MAKVACPVCGQSKAIDESGPTDRFLPEHFHHELRDRLDQIIRILNTIEAQQPR